MKNLFKFIIVSVFLLMFVNLGWSATYYSQGSVTPNTLSNWNTVRGGGGSSPANFTAGDIFVVQNGHTMVTSATWSISGTGSKLWIENGGILQSTFAITLNAATTFQIDDGGKYIHSNTTAFGSTIFQGTESFSSNSTVEFTDWNTTGPIVSIWGNIKFNATGAVAGSMQFSGNLTTVNGNFDVIATGTGTVREVRLATTQNPNITIAGNLNIEGGILNFASGASNTVINLGGNFSISGGTLTESSTGSGKINFNKSGVQTFTKTGGTISNTVNFTVLSGSILDMGGNVLDDASGSFNLNSGATLKTTHADGIHATGVTGCIQVGTPVYATGATYIYYRNGAQNTGTGLPQTSFTGLTVGSTDNATNLTINNATSTAIVGGTLTMISNSTSNSTIASGTIQFGIASSTLKYQGASSQTTTNAEFPSSNGPYSLTMDNANGVTLHSSRTLDGVLTLTSGKLTTGSNTLTLGTSTSSLGFLFPVTPSSASYIVGNFERWFAASTVTDVYFPVGTASRYLPAIISYTVAPTTGGKLKVSGHIDDPLADNTSNLDDGGYTIDRYSNSAWWQFTATTLAGGTYSLNLQGEGIAGADAVNYTKLRLLKRATGSQTWALSGTHVDATGSNTSPLIKRTGLTGFSEFGIGGNSADGNVLSDKPLPVILSSLSSSVINRNVKLNWTTSTETNNSGFDVERAEFRSQNLEFSKIGFINGHGTANTPTSYSFEDKNLQSGKYKYRLKQIDYNGNYEYFELNGEVEVGVPKKFDMSQNYPNPFNPVTKINFDLPENGLVNIRLYDMLGREVAVLVNEVRSAGYHTVQFDASKLSSGVYFYKMNAGKFNGIKKMAILK